MARSLSKSIVVSTEVRSGGRPGAGKLEGGTALQKRIDSNVRKADSLSFQQLATAKNAGN
jgi:hypothetical protein